MSMPFVVSFSAVKRREGLGRHARTCFAVDPGVAEGAGAVVGVDQVIARGSVQTVVRVALVDFCAKHKEQSATFSRARSIV